MYAHIQTVLLFFQLTCHTHSRWTLPLTVPNLLCYFWFCFFAFLHNYAIIFHLMQYESTWNLPPCFKSYISLCDAARSMKHSIASQREMVLFREKTNLPTQQCECEVSSYMQYYVHTPLETSQTLAHTLRHVETNIFFNN